MSGTQQNPHSTALPGALSAESSAPGKVPLKQGKHFCDAESDPFDGVPLKLRQDLETRFKLYKKHRVVVCVQCHCVILRSTAKIHLLLPAHEDIKKKIKDQLIQILQGCVSIFLDAADFSPPKFPLPRISELQTYQNGQKCTLENPDDVAVPTGKPVCGYVTSDYGDMIMHYHRKHKGVKAFKGYLQHVPSDGRYTTEGQTETTAVWSTRRVDNYQSLSSNAKEMLVEVQMPGAPKIVLTDIEKSVPALRIRRPSPATERGARQERELYLKNEAQKKMKVAARRQEKLDKEREEREEREEHERLVKIREEQHREMTENEREKLGLPPRNLRRSFIEGREGIRRVYKDPFIAGPPTPITSAPPKDPIKSAERSTVPKARTKAVLPPHVARTIGTTRTRRALSVSDSSSRGAAATRTRSVSVGSNQATTVPTKRKASEEDAIEEECRRPGQSGYRRNPARIAGPGPNRFQLTYPAKLEVDNTASAAPKAIDPDSADLGRKIVTRATTRAFIPSDAAITPPRRRVSDNRPVMSRPPPAFDLDVQPQSQSVRRQPPLSAFNPGDQSQSVTRRAAPAFNKGNQPQSGSQLSGQSSTSSQAPRCNSLVLRPSPPSRANNRSQLQSAYRPAYRHAHNNEVYTATEQAFYSQEQPFGSLDYNSQPFGTLHYNGQALGNQAFDPQAFIDQNPQSFDDHVFGIQGYSAQSSQTYNHGAGQQQVTRPNPIDVGEGIMLEGMQYLSSLRREDPTLCPPETAKQIATEYLRQTAMELLDLVDRVQE